MGSGSSISCDITLNSALRPDERAMYQNPRLIQQVLRESRTVAMVGLSGSSQRPSHFVGTYLKSEGYKVIPVNPLSDEILGERSFSSLMDIPADVSIDIVNIFRRPSECEQIVREAIDRGAGTVWMQLRVVNREAAALAREAGLNVIMDRCIKIEHGRYSGGLHWMGMNTEIISARRGSR
jgi:uncharacterized protein